jgi:phospholysine phosphohistidine inorganic pyrophosphate phosphatase
MQAGRLRSQKKKDGAAMSGMMFDLDGVIYNSETPIEGAAQTIAWVQREEIPYPFVTNTSSRGHTALVEKLFRFGIRTEPDRLWTPCIAAAEWLRNQQNGLTALFVAPKAREEFSGIPCIKEDAETGAKYVVVGDMGEHWDFHTLNRAFRLLHSNPESILIALGMTRFWLAQDGIRLDAAPFVTALEYATGKKALVLGKPAETFYQKAVGKLELPPCEITMFGDDILTDIGGAKKAGMNTVLLRTGKFRESDLEGAVAPDAVLNSIQDVPAWWKIKQRAQPGFCS